MEDKYYTPEPEELHIGFEIHRKGIKDGVSGYYPIVLTEMDICRQYIKNEIHRAETQVSLESNDIRVKYLDRQDIEGLGWDHDQTTKDGAYFYFGNMISKNHYCLNAPNARTSKGNNYTNLYIYSVDNNGNHFEGYIKNKSELKKLMKQLNICLTD